MCRLAQPLRSHTSPYEEMFISLLCGALNVDSVFIVLWMRGECAWRCFWLVVCRRLWDREERMPDRQREWQWLSGMPLRIQPSISCQSQLRGSVPHVACRGPCCTMTIPWQWSDVWGGKGIAVFRAVMTLTVCVWLLASLAKGHIFAIVMRAGRWALSCRCLSASVNLACKLTVCVRMSFSHPQTKGWWCPVLQSTFKYYLSWQYLCDNLKLMLGKITFIHSTDWRRIYAALRLGVWALTSSLPTRKHPAQHCREWEVMIIGPLSSPMEMYNQSLQVGAGVEVGLRKCYLHSGSSRPQHSFQVSGARRAANEGGERWQHKYTSKIGVHRIHLTVSCVSV